MWKKGQVVKMGKMGHALKIGSYCAKNGSKRKNGSSEKYFEKWDAVWKIGHSVKMGHSVKDGSQCKKWATV